MDQKITDITISAPAMILSWIEDNKARFTAEYFIGSAQPWCVTIDVGMNTNISVRVHADTLPAALVEAYSKIRRAVD